MLYTEDVRDWLKTVFSADNYYIGKLDNGRIRSVGVYPLDHGGSPVTGIGRDCSYDRLNVSILLHWERSAKTAEQAARQLFETIRTARSQIIRQHTIYYLDLLTPAPVFIGTDDKGVYEWVIECSFYYERK